MLSFLAQTAARKAREAKDRVAGGIYHLGQSVGVPAKYLPRRPRDDGAAPGQQDPQHDDPNAPIERYFEVGDDVAIGLKVTARDDDKKSVSVEADKEKFKDLQPRQKAKTAANIVDEAILQALRKGYYPIDLHLEGSAEFLKAATFRLMQWQEAMGKGANGEENIRGYFGANIAKDFKDSELGANSSYYKPNSTEIMPNPGLKTTLTQEFSENMPVLPINNRYNGEPGLVKSLEAIATTTPESTAKKHQILQNVRERQASSLSAEESTQRQALVGKYQTPNATTDALLEGEMRLAEKQQEIAANYENLANNYQSSAEPSQNVREAAPGASSLSREAPNPTAGGASNLHLVEGDDVGGQGSGASHTPTRLPAQTHATTHTSTAQPQDSDRTNPQTPRPALTPQVELQRKLAHAQQKAEAAHYQLWQTQAQIQALQQQALNQAQGRPNAINNAYPNRRWQELQARNAPPRTQLSNGRTLKTELRWQAVQIERINQQIRQLRAAQQQMNHRPAPAPRRHSIGHKPPSHMPGRPAMPVLPPHVTLTEEEQCSLRRRQRHSLG